MIATKNLRFQYPQGRALAFPDFNLSKGEHCLLLGESGCGKTTLLHLLGGLLKASNGSVVVSQEDLSKLSEHRLDRYRGKNFGFVFQQNHLISALTVEQNLLLANFLSLGGGGTSVINDLLTKLDLYPLRHVRVTKLSQGQAQRVGIARALVNRPAVILADEPTSALDDSNCERVIDLLITGAAAFEATLIIATHDHRLKQRISNCIQL